MRTFNSEEAQLMAAILNMESEGKEVELVKFESLSTDLDYARELFMAEDRYDSVRHGFTENLAGFDHAEEKNFGRADRRAKTQAHKIKVAKRNKQLCDLENIPVREMSREDYDNSNYKRFVDNLCHFPKKEIKPENIEELLSDFESFKEEQAHLEALEREYELAEKINEALLDDLADREFYPEPEKLRVVLTDGALSKGEYSVRRLDAEQIFKLLKQGFTVAASGSQDW